MKRKFIYRDEKSHKFWDITVNLSGLTVNFGKVGTAGQQQSKVFTSVEACFNAAEKLIAEKTKKGYQEVKEDLPSKDMYNDMIAVAHFLEANFPDKIEINKVTEENIGQMEAAAGFEMDEDFVAYWLEKGSVFFDKGDFVFALYAYDQAGQIANHLYGVLGFYASVHGTRFDILDMEEEYLSQGTMVLGTIIQGNEMWVLVQNRVGIYQLHFEDELKHYTEEAFAEKIAPVLQGKGVDVESVTDDDDGPSQFEVDHQLRCVTYEEILTLLGVDKLWDYWDDDNEKHGYESEAEYYEDAGAIYVCDGDLHIAGDCPGYMALLVVRGNLTVTGMIRDVAYYVTGDVTADYLGLGHFQHTGGTETIRYVASVWAEDDGRVETLPSRKINVPYFFSWFYDLNSFKFGPDTVITALYDQDELNSYETNNVFLPWHDYAFVFRDEFCYLLEQPHHDSLGISPGDVYKALKAGRPVFRDGVTIEGIKLFNKALRQKNNGDRPGAYLALKEVMAKSPGYYLAYYHAGMCLFHEKAYLQAKEMFLRAIPLAPAKVQYDAGAISTAALCDVILGHYDEAIALADTGINKDPYAYFAMRVKAEALILQGKLGEAKPLLERSVDISSTFSGYWLLGLVYHLEGNKKKATEYYDNAAYYSAKALPYSEHTTLHYFYGDNITVNWETHIPEKKVVEKGQAYWDQYFDNNHKQQHADWVTAIPEAFRTKEMLETLLEKYETGGDVIRYFDPSVYTPDIILAAVKKKHPVYFDNIPPAFLSVAVLEAYPYDTNFGYYPKELLDYDVYFRAVMKTDRVYKDIPAVYKDERMNIALIAGGCLGRYSNQALPAKYRAPEYLKQAIDLGMQVITKIPANLVDQEVYVYAVAKYGQEPAWPFIVDQYSRDHWMYNGRSDIEEMGARIQKYGIDVFDHVNKRQINKHSFAYYQKYLGQHPEFQARAEAAGWLDRNEITGEYMVKDQYDSSTFEDVWACFWDEEFIIRALTAHEPNRSERILDVPAKYLTQKICDIAVARNSYDYEFVPDHLKTPELTELAVSRDYGAALEYVPLPLRTKRVCELALGRDYENIKFVPVALREPVMFVQVLTKDRSFTKYIPWQQYYAVFELLTKQFKNRFDKDYLSLHSGVGLILDGQYAAAREKLGKFDDVVFQHQAAYYTGWSYFLEGDAEKAAEWYKRSQELGEIDKQEILDMPYATFRLPDVPDVYAMNQGEFDAQMREATILLEIRKYEDAIDILARAEKMLADAGCSEMRLWAYVWDYQRFVWYEAGRKEEALALSARTVEKLGKVSLWPYLEAHNPIRHAIRSAHNSLAYRCYETATELKGVLEGINHMKVTMKTVAPIEDKHVLDQYLETQALLYYKAMGFDRKYQKDFDRVMVKIGKLKDKSILSEEILGLM
jgi:predicted DNA-binding WGR domain protein/tetratricopeptide (TPR) repeat protein